MPSLDVPEFLKMSQADRKAAWENFRAIRPLPPEKYQPRRISDAPGEPDDKS